jgi:hypothetical protein
LVLYEAFEVAGPVEVGQVDRGGCDGSGEEGEGEKEELFGLLLVRKLLGRIVGDTIEEETMFTCSMEPTVSARDVGGC